MAPLSVEAIDRFITPGSPLARAGGARALLRATKGNLAGAAFLAALARKESSFGATAGRFKNNYWGWGVHLGPNVNTSPSVEAGAAKVWKGLNSSLYRGAGLTNPTQIINRYAPPSENNTALYQQQVNQWFTQMGLSPKTNIFAGATSPAPGGADLPTALPGAGDVQQVAGSLDAKRLMMLLDNQRARSLRGLMPAQGFQRELAKVVSQALPRAAVHATGQQVGAQASAAAQQVASFAGLSAGGGPEDHGRRALGNWQSDNAYDLMGKAGDAIPAMVTGTVAKISGQPGGNPGFAGYGITVRTAQGDLFFKHLGTANVKPGQKVTPRTIIGTLDPSTAGGPHLHLGGQNRGFLDSLAKLYTRRPA